jgi:secreted PhoX family phosphatase
VGDGAQLRGELQSYGLKRSMPFALGWIRDDGSTPEELNYYIGEPGTNVDNQRVTDQWPFYGYVTEIDPYTGNAVKHTALGRIHHENVGLRVAPNGTVVAYSGDDAPAADGMFFKFVSARRWRRGMARSEAMSLLSEGQLFVAQWFPQANDPNVQSGEGRWHALDMRDPEALAFTTPWIEKNIVPRAGGDLRQFRVPRAEDCEVLPNAPQRVLISLTSARGRPADRDAYGVVRLLREDQADPASPTFKWVDLLEGGEQTGFANPDNLAFSSARELWIVTDVSSSRLNVPGRFFEWHMNNAMFYVPLRGPNAMTAFRFANGPVEAELTGPSFNMPQKTLFLNVQHPGEETPNRSGADPRNPQTFTSWWPEGNRTAGTGTPGKPKPSLVAIRKLG